MKLHPGMIGLAAAVVLTMGTTAGAEENKIALNARDLSVSSATETLVICGENSGLYGLIDANGNAITEEKYDSIYAVSNMPYFKVKGTSADGLHREGLLDDQGNELVPAQYADVDVVSDIWQVGLTLTPSSADDKDYTVSNWSTGENEFYRIDQADFYFRGEKVGTLSRSEYDGYPTAHGDYICVTDRTKNRTFYNSRFEKSPYAADYSAEYESEYKNGSIRYYHQGTGQQAFTEGCTLTPEEVESAYTYYEGVVYDLQGGEAFRTAQNYDTVRDYKDGYAVVSMNRKEGVIDLSGREIIPVEYDNVGNYSDHPFAYGYISAVKDGKFGFLDLNGNVTCDFVYSEDAVDDRGSFGQIQNLDGSIIILSAAVGELPEHYKDVSFPSYSNSRCFIAENENGEESLIDLYGNTLIPFGEYRISANAAGTVAVVRPDYHNYEIYHFDASAASAAPAAGTPAEGTEDAEDTSKDNVTLGENLENAPEEAAPAPESWTCENGHEGNTGNFCSECGAPKPAEEALTACPECGYEFGDTAPKFCPNCGTSLADAA